MSRSKPIHPDLANSPILYPFPRYLLLKKPTKQTAGRTCLFCGYHEVSSQRKFLRHAVTRIVRPDAPRYSSGTKRYLTCWELAALNDQHKEGVAS